MQSMSKVKKAVVVTLLLIGALLSSACIFWANDMALSVDRPGFLKLTPEGNAAISFDKSIYIVDATGTTKEILNFQSQGLTPVGNYDFYRNGDILLYHKDSEPTFFENIAAFLRLNKSDDERQSADKGLYRCASGGGQCNLFSPDLRTFGLSFHIHIDRETDIAYISDTSRSILYKIDGYGNLLASSDKKLKFPNQILVKDAKLYVVNTNRKEIKSVEIESDVFGEPIANYTVEFDVRNRWPSHIAASEGNWWLIINDTNMANGKLVHFDQEWNMLGALTTKTEADFTSLAVVADQLWASSWSDMGIARFDLNGAPLDDFYSPQLSPLFAAQIGKEKYFESLSHLGIAAFVLVVIGGFVAAFVLERKETLSILNPKHVTGLNKATDGILETPPGEGVYWIYSRFEKSRKLIKFFAIAITLLLVVAYLGILFTEDYSDWHIHFMVISMIPLGVVLYQLWTRVADVRIGIDGEMLLIEEKSGKSGTGKESDIKYSNSMLMVENAIAMLGNPRQPLYPKAELDRWVFPRMHLGQEIGGWQATKLMWREKHPAILREC